MRVDDLVLEKVEQIPKFTFKWPDGVTVEEYDDAWQATAVVNGRRHWIRHGLTNRVALGRRRRRATTWVDQRYVEGVGCDDYASSHALVSLLKRSKKLLTEPDQVGPAYEGFETVRYSDEVDAKGADSGMAVKIREDDVRRWAFHALVRYGMIDAEWPDDGALTDPEVLRRHYDGGYRAARAPDGDYAPWHARYVECLTEAAAARTARPVDLSFQEMLWDESPLGSVGVLSKTMRFANRPGFPRFASIAADLVSPPLPEDEAARVAELRRRYDELVAASSRLLKFNAAPRAKVLRYLAAYHPQDVSCIFSAGMRRLARALTGAAPPHHPIDVQFAIVRALDRALGPSPTDADGLAARAKFPWWLLEKVVKPSASDPATEESEELDHGPPPPTEGTGSDPTAAWVEPTIDQLLARFADVPLVLPPDLVVRLHLALHANDRKHFVLLAGLSGTGKTQLACVYANLMHGLAAGESNPWLHIDAVQPDWTDPTALLGYANPLRDRPTYQRTALLNFLLAAPDDDRPRFLVLDEMNLARPEHYFAPFLSAMETGAPLAIHAQPGAVDLVPPEIPWPRNLFIIGTVNMDETTHGFSDKVLDRAFTIELWDVDLVAFREKLQAISPDVAEPAFAMFAALQALLAPLRAQVGYRNLEEILRFLDANARLGASALPWSDALDHALMMKVLPRLRGEDSPRLREGLAAVRKLCSEHGLERCAAKVASMLDDLVATGTTRFWS